MLFLPTFAHLPTSKIQKLILPGLENFISTPPPIIFLGGGYYVIYALKEMYGKLKNIHLVYIRLHSSNDSSVFLEQILKR